MASSNGASDRPPFRRIAVVNRGESAMRLVHAVRDLNAADPAGTDPIRVIALYTDAEPAAMFVREADVAWSLGPASARPYLNHDLLEEALLATRADAVWVGWGFVAEDPTFADLCARLGVTFIGPVGRGHAAARRQGRLETARRAGRRPGRPVEPRAGRHPGRRAHRRRVGRVPADAQGHRRGRRPGHPRRPGRRRAARRPTSAPGTRRDAPSATTSCSWNASSPAPGTSRCR